MSTLKQTLPFHRFNAPLREMAPRIVGRELLMYQDQQSFAVDVFQDIAYRVVSLNTSSAQCICTRMRYLARPCDGPRIAHLLLPADPQDANVESLKLKINVIEEYTFTYPALLKACQNFNFQC
ncbi:hypothetical protein DFH28DRAFT_1128495 [Melampsora americana]|nr:hypothetical protein DFH28DRAFT_1128495 [Melampsora americana]